MSQDFTFQGIEMVVGSMQEFYADMLSDEVLRPKPLIDWLNRESPRNIGPKYGPPVPPVLVRDLIEALQKLDPDAVVMTWDGYTYDGEYVAQDLTDLDLTVDADGHVYL